MRPITEAVILKDGRIEMLTNEELVSLLSVGDTCAVLERPALIPAEHSVRLIALGYMVTCPAGFGGSKI
jgi:hypothetical protein